MIWDDSTLSWLGESKGETVVQNWSPGILTSGVVGLPLGYGTLPPGFSRGAAGALDIPRGPKGPALVASRKASPHASCSGASRDSSPFDAGA